MGNTNRIATHLEHNHHDNLRHNNRDTSFKLRQHKLDTTCQQVYEHFDEDIDCESAHDSTCEYIEYKHKSITPPDMSVSQREMKHSWDQFLSSNLKNCHEPLGMLFEQDSHTIPEPKSKVSIQKLYNKTSAGTDTKTNELKRSPYLRGIVVTNNPGNHTFTISTTSNDQIQTINSQDVKWRWTQSPSEDLHRTQTASNLRRSRGPDRVSNKISPLVLLRKLSPNSTSPKNTLHKL